MKNSFEGIARPISPAPEDPGSGVRQRPSETPQSPADPEVTRITDISSKMAEREKEERTRVVNKDVELQQAYDRLKKEGQQGVVMGDGLKAFGFGERIEVPTVIEPMEDIATPEETAQGTQIFLRSEPRFQQKDIATPEERAQGMEIYARSEPTKQLEKTVAEEPIEDLTEFAELVEDDDEKNAA